MNCICGETDPALFGPDKRHKNGKRSRCRNCERKSRNYDPTRQLWQNRKWRYGVDEKKFDEMAENQFGLCAICKEKLPAKNETNIDHCHETGKVRGLLCPACNTLIGLIEKKGTNIIGNIVDYLL